MWSSTVAARCGWLEPPPGSLHSHALLSDAMRLEHGACASALVVPTRRSTPSMRAPWLKFAAAPGALAPRALQRGRDPRTLGEAWRWCRSIGFQRTSANTQGQRVLRSIRRPRRWPCMAVHRWSSHIALRRARRATSGPRGCVGTRIFADIPLARGSLSCSRELASRGVVWLAALYIFGFFQLARALNSTRPGRGASAPTSWATAS